MSMLSNSSFYPKNCQLFSSTLCVLKNFNSIFHMSFF
nr:MAG TPA: hypothetical protein [Caudoviricetes sp.]